MLPRNKNLKNNSRLLRKNTTKEENHLWYDFLKTYPMQFMRQKVIGNFIVDFYCDKAKLVVELDGSAHYEVDVQKYDEDRTAYLNNLGIEVIRFSNLDVNEYFDEVCEYIDMTVCKKLEGNNQPSWRVQSNPSGKLPSSVACGDSFPQGKPKSEITRFSI